MSPKILVTYASRAGSTRGVAEAISQTLSQRGFDVDVKPMADIHSVTGYDAIIAGSAIRIDKWLPEAMQFIEKYQQELTQKSFSAFVVCLAMSAQNEKRRKKALITASNYLKPVREIVPTISEGLFAGVLNLSKLSLGWRILFGIVTLLGFFQEGDYRDWDAIHEWANNLALELATSANDRS